MAQLSVFNRDFSGIELTDIGLIRFRGLHFKRYARFQSDQFGPGLIEEDVLIDGGKPVPLNDLNLNHLTINVVSGDDFSAARWSFMRWEVGFIAIAWDQQVGNVIGSPVEDDFFPSARADLIDGGGMSDYVNFGESMTAQRGDVITGGDDVDMFRINFPFRRDYPDEPISEARKHVGIRLDLTDATVTSFEHLRFYCGDDDHGSAALFRGDAFGPDGFLSIDGGPGADTLVIEANGPALDLAHLEFDEWTNGLDRVVLRGRGTADALIGTDQDDWINGRAGADTLVGGEGRDRLSPGNDTAADVIRVLSVAESAGAGRDLVIGLDLGGEDRFHLAVTPAHFAAPIAGVELNEASFAADLFALLNETALPAGEAVLIDPDSGTADYANTVYLVVDANGIAGYQADGDYVFQIEGAIGTFEPADFV